MERFEELKQELLKRAKDAGACKAQYARAYSAQTLEQLMKVCCDNFHWACTHRVLDIDIIKLYHDEFASGSIYANEDTIRGYLLCNDAIVKACDNARVIAYDNAIVEAYDNAIVEACDNAIVKAYDNAGVEAYGNAIVIAYDNARVEAYGNAYITSFLIIEVKLSGNAMYRIKENNTIKYANPKMKFELVE